MEQNSIKDGLVKRLEIVDLENDIKRLTAELDTHKSKTVIFEHTIQAQQADLDEILGTRQHPKLKEEIYR